jgi:hypothetical protein
MGRTVVSRRDLLRSKATLGSDGPESVLASEDQYLDRLIKYIPPDVIIAYTTIEGVIRNSKEASKLAAWSAFAVILIATPVYLVRLGKVRKPVQVIISTIAFALWACAYPAPPFNGNRSGLWTTLALALYTFLIPLFTAEAR